MSSALTSSQSQALAWALVIAYRVGLLVLCRSPFPLPCISGEGERAMEDAERFEILQPTYVSAPVGWGSDDDELDAHSASVEGVHWTPRTRRIMAELPPPLGVPSYAKDTQSSIRKKPRRSLRRIGGDGPTSDDDGDEDAAGYPGGVGMKGKSCFLVSMRLKTLPIALTATSPHPNNFPLMSPRNAAGVGLDWGESLSRTVSASIAPPFSIFGGGKDGSDRITPQLSMSACSRIEYLYLRGNLLRGLWDTRCTPNLIVLDVSENELESLDGVEHLERLQHLYVNSNALSSIEEVPLLPNLTVLSLSCNRIRSLNHMQQQPSLELLSLSDNEIPSMAGLNTCPHLVSLRLNGNPISQLSGYRLAVLLSAAACGMLELAKLDGDYFVENELAQAACLGWPQRLSALYGWIPGMIFRRVPVNVIVWTCS